MSIAVRLLTHKEGCSLLTAHERGIAFAQNFRLQAHIGEPNVPTLPND